jgi:palmitoyl-protein thioesterase
MIVLQNTTSLRYPSIYYFVLDKMHHLTILLPSLLAFPLATSAKLSQQSIQIDDPTPLPVIIWHGLGDNYAADWATELDSLANAIFPGTFTYAIRLSDSASEDRRQTFFGNVTEQIQSVCDDLAAHPILSTAPAVDAMGFSQGGQFLRAYIERCNKPPVRSLVTFGSQHNGISKFQDCGANDWVCKGANSLLHGNTWSSFVQSRLVPAQYFRDPEDLDTYMEHSNFLADINNERTLKNSTYKENLSKLKNFVMYLFEEDKTVVPKETSWFADVVQEEVVELRNRTIYKEDWLGLKELDERGALKFEVTPGPHMSISDKVFTDVIMKYFGPLDGESKSRIVSHGPEEL